MVLASGCSAKILPRLFLWLGVVYINRYRIATVLLIIVLDSTSLYLLRNGGERERHWLQ